MKDHEIAQIVNRLRDIAKEYGQTQQLRERIADVIVPLLAAAPAAIDKEATLDKPANEQEVDNEDDADDYPPTPESERAAFNAMMRWHLIRMLQAWRYGGDLRAAGMAAFEWARSNDVGKDAFKASEQAVKLAASPSANVAQGAEAVPVSAIEAVADFLEEQANIGIISQFTAVQEWIDAHAIRPRLNFSAWAATHADWADKYDADVMQIGWNAALSYAASPSANVAQGLASMALRLARETFMMNKIDVPRVIEKIDEALSASGGE